MTQKITKILSKKILEPETPVRLNPRDASIQELAESIKAIGLLQPIIVRQEGDYYRVICGHRRFLACKTAGLKEIPCIINDDEEERDLEKMLAENIARKNMSPIEEAAFFKEAMDKLEHTPKSLAEAIGRSKTYVTTRLKILDYPPEIQKAIHEEKLSLAVADILAQITDEEVRERYLHDAIERQISAQTAKLWLQIWQEHKDYTEKGASDPRALAMQPSEDHIYGTCNICGEKTLFKYLASLITCNRCRQLIGLFWEEYKRAGNDNNGRTERVHTSNMD